MRLSSRRPLSLLPLLLTFIVPGVCLAGPPPSDSFDEAYASLASVREFKETALSSDGRTVAWIEKAAGEGTRSGSTALFVKRLGPPGPPRRVRASGVTRESGLAFSRNGGSLAFVGRSGNEAGSALFVVRPEGGMPRKVVSFGGALASPVWSPDGKSIAVLAIENPSKEAGPLGPTARDAGLVEARIDEQRIAIVDPAGGELRLVSPPDLYVYELDWSPDGKTFAATAAPGAGDDNWYIASLVTIDAANGRVETVVKPPLQIANPRWSPDGASIAYIGGLMSDEGVTGGEIFVVPARGGEPRNLTPARPSSPAWLAWLPKGILFVERAGGSLDAGLLDPGTGRAEPVLEGSPRLSTGEGIGLSLSRDGSRAAAIRSSFSSPPEIWAGPVGALRKVTNRNRAARPAWGDAKSVEAEVDGFRVQGWLLPPRETKPGTRYPMAVYVHGGPASSVLDAWPNPWIGILPSRGSFVFLPNPRGSYGRGEAFTRANVKDFGYGDLKDILAGVDAVLKSEPVDPDRLGLFGWSYGGFMTMFAVTQTNRFKAAVAGAGIANWQSYYGQNRIDQWLIPYFGASVYDDPAVYARSSPITFIKSVKTPTLVLQGERDAEVPAPQAYEFWHALKVLGVPTGLVIYPDEGHHLDRPEHEKDRVRRTVEWLEKYLR